jgi:GH15 family glucan-1,4-alpha-glucosidase
MTSANFVLAVESRKELASLFKIDENSTLKQFAQASVKAGDAVLYRLYQHVKNDNGHIAEQIGKTSGAQTSANDLTWSYANILSALHYRGTQLS